MGLFNSRDQCSYAYGLQASGICGILFLIPTYFPIIIYQENNYKCAAKGNTNILSAFGRTLTAFGHTFMIIFLKNYEK